MAGSQVFPSLPSSGGAGTPATTVVSETTFGQSPAVGTSLNYAREDHTHGTPAIPAAAGWTDGGTVIYTTTATDQVAIGTSTAAAQRLLTLQNIAASNLFGVRVVSDAATTENVFETRSLNGASPDDTSARLAITGAGDYIWTDGAGASTVRLYRSATNQLTYDNGASGSAIFQFLGTLITQRRQVQVTTTSAASYSVAATDYVIISDSSAGNTGVVLQSAIVQVNRVVVVKRKSTLNTVTVTATAGNVEGAASYVLPSGGFSSATFVSDGTNWWII
jgi:hypothetical protein